MSSASEGLRPLCTGADVLPRSPCSPNIPNLCDSFVKKLVSEIRKCRQLQRDEVSLTLLPGTLLLDLIGAPPPDFMT